LFCCPQFYIFSFRCNRELFTDQLLAQSASPFSLEGELDLAVLLVLELELIALLTVESAVVLADFLSPGESRRSPHLRTDHYWS
jgi:hypothetical protein